MFGYVRINKPELKVREYERYQSYYCGLCRTLKQRYGITGQLTLTYDFTFLIVLLSALYECEDTVVREHCKTHPVGKKTKRFNVYTEYAADMNLLLAYYHMVDDWRDEKSKKALIFGRLLCSDAGKVVRTYKRQAGIIQRELKKLSRLEEEQCTNLDELSGCFGRMMGACFVYQQDEYALHLRKMGFFLGKFIYLMDAWEDLPEDERKGVFNPLKAMSREPGFEDFMRNALNMLMAECTREFEFLPILRDAELLRNILYAGVWQKYNKIVQEQQGKGKEKNDK